VIKSRYHPAIESIKFINNIRIIEIFCVPVEETRYSVFIWDVNTLIQEKAAGNRQQATGERDIEFLITRRKNFLGLQLI
jgi:hypothetical protein